MSSLIKQPRGRKAVQVIVGGKRLEAEERLLDVKDMAERLRVSTKTVRTWAGLEKGMRALDGFPRPLRIGGHICRWREADANEYIRNFGKQ